jgi:hypothetical protein
MDECKRPSPGKIARAFHNLGSFWRVYRNFRERAASQKTLILMKLERNSGIALSSRKDSKANRDRIRGSLARGCREVLESLAFGKITVNSSGIDSLDSFHLSGAFIDRFRRPPSRGAASRTLGISYSEESHDDPE